MATAKRNVNKNQINGGNKWNSERGSGKCSVCNSTCYYKCSRCLELFYCSEQCQKQDWTQHKHACFRMPPLIHINNLGASSNGNYAYPVQMNGDNQNGNFGKSGHNQSSQSTRSLSSKQSNESIPSRKIQICDPPNNNHKVLLTCVSKGNAFYIRAYAKDVEYTKNSEDFNEYGRTAKMLTETPNRSEIVLVQHNKTFVRGIMLSSHSMKINLALADIGSTVTKTLNDLRWVNDDLALRNRSNVKIILQHMPEQLDDESMAYLENCITKKTIFKIQFDGNDFSSGCNFKLVEQNSETELSVLLEGLKNRASSNSSLNHAVKSPEPTFTKAELQADLTYPKFFWKDLKYVKLSKIAHVLIVDTSKVADGFVSVVPAENNKQWVDLHLRIKENKLYLKEEYQADQDEICLVKWKEDGEWYRAQCTDLETNCFYFIDYGNEVCIDQTDVRKIAMELRGPCYTALCQIRDCPIDADLNMELLEELQEFCNGSEHKDCKVTLEDEGFNLYGISLPEVSKYYRKMISHDK